MKNLFISSVTACSILFLTGCATQMANDSNAPTGNPSATLRVEAWQAAYYGSAAGGEGMLRYNGQDHDFTVVSAGAGGTGAQKVTATGQVYNLNRLADFPGTYTGVRSGFTLIQGKMHEKLTNEKGTVIYITGHTKGLASTTGADKVVITLK